MRHEHEHATYNRRQDAAAMNLTHDGLRQSCSDLDYRQRLPSLELPDDDNDAVEYVVRVPDVSEQAEGEQHETHLQDKHAGENDVTDLQDVGQLLGLDRTAQQKERVNMSTFTPCREKNQLGFTDTSGCWSLVQKDLQHRKHRVRSFTEKAALWSSA